MATPECLHQSAQGSRIVVDAGEEIEAVIRQAVGMQCDALRFDTAAQQPEPSGAVRVVARQHLSVLNALAQQMSVSGDKQTGQAGHAALDHRLTPSGSPPPGQAPLSA